MKKEYIILFAIFLVTFGFQLFFSLQVSYFSSDDAYFSLRHAEYIQENFKPMIHDDMSYGGNYILNTHLWHYFLALIGFLPLIFMKIIPGLLASSVVFFVYLLSKQITGNKTAAMFGALIAAFVPTYIAITLNQVSIYSIYVPLLLGLIYSLFEIKKRLTLFLILSFIIILLDPMNFLMLLTLLVFMILVVAESLPVKKQIGESFFLFVLLMILVNLILFKDLYFSSGLEALWQNMPDQLYESFFKDFDVVSLTYNIGFLPLVLGFVGLGLSLATEKKNEVYLLSSMILADVGLLALKLVPYDIGVMFLAILLCIASTLTINELIDYIKLTKAAKQVHWVILVVTAVTLVSLVIPAIVNAEATINDGVSAPEVEALTWIKDNTPESSVVLGNVFEGNLILEIAERTNVIDTQFLLAEDRYYDVELMYTTGSLYKAVVALNTYQVDYIYLSDSTKEMFDIEEIIYVGDETCFELVFENEEALVYEKVC
tara:strand:+ start:2052 stop:3512 length:1461 start_codon:yes stop_codon:yes gene_type:complete